MSQLNEKGQCCGRKPIVYKRNRYKFCGRCRRAFDLETGEQKGNWAWKETEPGVFERRDRIDLLMPIG